MIEELQHLSRAYLHPCIVTVTLQPRRSRQHLAVKLLDYKAPFSLPLHIHTHDSFKMKVLLPFSLLLASASAISVWPLPVSYTTGNTTLWVDKNVQITVSGVAKVSKYLKIQKSRKTYGGPFLTNILILFLFSRQNTNLTAPALLWVEPRLSSLPFLGHRRHSSNRILCHGNSTLETQTSSHQRRTKCSSRVSLCL